MTSSAPVLAFAAPGGTVTVAIAAFVALVLLAMSGWEAWTGRSSPRVLARFGLRMLGIIGGFLLAVQPTWLEPRVEISPGRVALLFDASRSMGVGIGADTRARSAARVAEALRDETGAPDVTDVITYAFDGQLEGTDLAKLARDYPREGERTSLIGAIAEVARGDDASELGAIVVVSDGADTDGRNQAELASLGVRVHTVYAEGPPLTRDDSVVEIEADPVVFVRQPFEISAKVRCLGCRSEVLEATLYRGDELRERRPVELDDEGEGVVRFSAVESRLGRRTYRVSLARAEGDQIPENNARSVLVRVARDRLRVLLVAGRPSWDVRFLRGFLKGDPSVDLVSFFILRSNSDLTMADASEMALIPFPTDELFREHLGSFDLVIFQNFNYGPYRMAPYLSRIRDYVRRGGAFAMLGGDVSFAAGGYVDTPVAEVLPVRLRRVAASGSDVATGAFSPMLDPTHRAHPIVAFSNDAESNAELWATRAPVIGMNLVAGTRDGGSPLLLHPSVRLASGDPMPFLVVGEAGEGRTMALLSDSSWRWSIATAGRTGDASAYARFWDRAIRWLSRDPSLEPTRVTTDRERYGPSARVGVEARIRMETYEPRAGLAVRISVVDEVGEAVASKEARTDREGRVRLTIEGPEAAGAYRVIVSEASTPGVLGEEPFLVEAAGDELTDPRANPVLLERIAEATGGVAYRSSDAPSLEDLDTSRERSLGYASWAPFASPWFVTVLLVLWAAEWWIRRRGGLR